ncbi:class I adenylate-forming enzyme family protein [Actinoplanes couchii]|uniref:AMP-dependent synthetase n=1 Tax=Actinoplanes couchii TaxID=403638 RepID=A0ABQ3XBM7_9ACTN|nr:fatty acid--CoA ligase family protein [Actinoplanes couchii]MDR6323402.1 acyl-CoA synthetase (AMP-forming)/AMP-acid ligase II [Actinoplanes couchii]GID55917.1 AMP-dependent synthetase [Actinoplanes couchii]
MTTGAVRSTMDQLLADLRERGDAEAMAGHDGSITYAGLAERTTGWLSELDKIGMAAGDVVAIVGNAAPDVVALFMALAIRGGVVVPLAPTDPPREQRASRLATAHAGRVIEFHDTGEWTVQEITPPDAPRPGLLAGLTGAGEAGLLLFSSGSTGESKAALLSLPRLFGGLHAGGRPRRTLQFMALDHIGGVNTLFRTLIGGGTVVTEPRRTPKTAAEAIERHRVQVLPTTPTFLNMLLLSGAYREHDLTSLELITYGTEPMREVTLAHAAEVFPGVRFKQTYGLTETGILPTRSVSSDSLLMDVGGHGFDTRIRDGVLWIKSPSAMLGYLNAPSPFDEDGWLDTGDAVEVAADGSLRVLGRLSALINVGGEKVSPAEVENVLLRAPNVKDVVVSGRANAVTGAIVVAIVEPVADEDRKALARRLRQFCSAALPPHKVPAVITVSDGPLHGERFKRMGGTR